MQIIEDLILDFRGLLGLDEVSAKILICALLSFPFSVIFKRLPDKQYGLKNFYNIGVSAFYVFGILNLYSGFLTLCISSFGCYFITRYVRIPAMPWINFIFLMSHLAYTHIHTQFFNVYDPSKVDISGAQMVLVIKLTSFGWNVYDGKQPKESLTPYNKARIIKKHPNLLMYIGYVFFYVTFLTGPSFDYADYERFIYGTLFSDVPDSKRPGKTKRIIPRSGRASLKRSLHGCFWAFIFLQSSKFVDLEYVLSGKFVEEHGFIYRIFYIWALGFSYRLKYYTIWLIAEGACILCGIGYNGYDKETDSFMWDRVKNVDPFVFETGQNVHVCLEAWNMNTNKWLKNYIYLRVAKKGRKPGFKSTLFTFTTSAFWHGTRPGYYLTFVVGAFLQTVGKIYRRNFRPMFIKEDGKTPTSTKWIYDIISYFTTQLAFGLFVQPFVILDFRKSIYCWSTCYFYVHIILILTLIAFKGPYAKKVTNFCRSFHPAVIAAKKSKLSEEEKLRIRKAVEERFEREENEIPTLGLPSIEVLETMSMDEFEADLKDFNDIWVSFKSRVSSTNKDDSFEGFKAAYKNFTDEVNDFFHSKKDQLASSPSNKKND